MITGNIRILLIEDDCGDAAILKRSLKTDASIDLVWEQRLESGLERLRNESFDLVLSDLSLPDSSGDQAVAKIRDLSDAIPIIVLTGLDDGQLAMNLLESGVQDYFVKGEVTGGRIVKGVRHAIQRQGNLVQIRKLLASVEEQKLQLDRKNKKLSKLYAQAHQFVDNVSHEFRTPLTVVKEYVSLVREGYAGEVNTEQTRLLTIAEDRADDLNTMVDDMLDVSKLEAGMLGAWRKNCTADCILDNVRDALLRKAAVKNVTLQWHVQENLPELYCDAEKAGRAITNLAVNAIKFCGSPGVVQIKLARDMNERDVRISITDNGRGIETDELNTIFGRFKQLTGNLHGSTNGFGLGLNIAKELVDLNFGELNVTSEIGEGSTFSFTLPITDPIEVLSRFQTRIEQQSQLEDDKALIAIVEVVCSRNIEQSLQNDCDSFLNYCLRKNDLLFRLSDNRWAVVLPETEAGVDDYQQKTRQEWEAVNRNRPFGPLPEFQTERRGSWQIDEHPDAAAKCMNALMQTKQIETNDQCIGTYHAPHQLRVVDHMQFVDHSNDASC